MRKERTTWKTTRPQSREERYGHLWAAVFLVLVVSLLLTLGGKACLG